MIPKQNCNMAKIFEIFEFYEIRYIRLRISSSKDFNQTDVLSICTDRFNETLSVLSIIYDRD